MCDFAVADFNVDFFICGTPPTETLTFISPAQVCEGAAAFSLQVIGTGFTGSAVVKVNGSTRTTVIVSATQLLATIPASDLVLAGSLAVTVVDGVTTLGPNYLNVVVCPVPAAGKGPISRPRFDHLADVRASDNQLNKLQELIATNDVLRRVSRQ